MEDLEMMLSVLTLVIIASVLAVSVMMFITEGQKAFTPLIEEWCNSKGIISLVTTIAIAAIMINTQTLLVVVAVATAAMILGFKAKENTYVAN